MNSLQGHQLGIYLDHILVAILYTEKAIFLFTMILCTGKEFFNNDPVNS